MLFRELKNCGHISGMQIQKKYAEKAKLIYRPYHAHMLMMDKKMFKFVSPIASSLNKTYSFALKP